MARALVLPARNDLSHTNTSTQTARYQYNGANRCLKQGLAVFVIGISTGSIGETLMRTNTAVDRD